MERNDIKDILSDVLLELNKKEEDRLHTDLWIIEKLDFVYNHLD